ncbi:unnamed protein product [Hydatigera taeniaeformis]|uniref:HECT domain-containing protein n=1 Tax=Hydatigena taeniaeformis TaxID=6205 RepID=A0A158RDT3_HYDTA|nr:unnamed protein product [Hydatigera taeniaeformis]
MRLKLPQPVQLWFNSISTSAKRHLHMEKLEEEVNDGTTVSNSFIVEAVQNLCYEIFAIPVCTSDAVNVAQTICGHIYDLAQSSNPALQLIVLDLIPTLVHVYLVLSTTFPSSFGGFPTSDRASVSHRHAKSSVATTGTTEAPTATTSTTNAGVASPRSRKSLRHRLKKTSVISVDALRRPNFNRTVRRHTRRILAGFTSDPTNVSNIGTTAAPADSSTHSSSSATATTAKSCSTTASIPSSLSASEKVPAIGTHMASLAAVLETLLLGLYNTYARRLATSRSWGNLYSSLPTFASGSVFCGPLDIMKSMEEHEMEMVRSFLHLFPNRSSTAHAAEQFELTACNRWRVLCLLCRLSTERIDDLSDRGREALCHLALLLGPRGLHEYRFPPPVATATTDASSPRRRRSRWSRFARHHHHRRHSRGARHPSSPTEPRASTPLRASQYQSDRVIAAAARLDLARIAAPLRSVVAAQQGGTSASTGMQPSFNLVGQCDSKDTASVDMKKKSEEDDSDNDPDLSASQTPTSSINTDSSNGTSAETGSNASVCSDDYVNDDAFDASFSILDEEEGEENSYVDDEDREYENEEDEVSDHHSPLPVNGVLETEFNRNALNVDSEGTGPPKAEVDETFTNAQSILEDCEPVDINDGDDDAVTANSHSSCTLDPLHKQKSQQQSLEQLLHQQESHTTTAPMPRISDVGERKTSRRRQFHGLGRSSGGEKERHARTGMVGVFMGSVRIPRLPAQFALDLLPGLHFALTTAQSRLAATAIDSLARRADLELWSNVLLYTNSIRNSKAYVDAATASLDQNCIVVSVGQSNQSNGSVTLRGLSPGASRASSVTGSGTSSTLEEQRYPASPVTVIKTSRQPRQPMAITNASFHVVRPEEDIPPMKTEGRINSDVNKNPGVSNPPPPLLLSTSPYHTREASPLRRLHPRSKSLSPRYKEAELSLPSRGFLRLNCAGCSTSKPLVRQRALSFNPRLCSALRNSRSKSPYHLKVTFADESGIDRREVLSPPVPTPLLTSPPTPRSI